MYKVWNQLQYSASVCVFVLRTNTFTISRREYFRSLGLFHIINLNACRKIAIMMNVYFVCLFVYQLHYLINKLIKDVLDWIHVHIRSFVTYFIAQFYENCFWSFMAKGQL